MPFLPRNTSHESVHTPAWRRYLRFWGPRVEGDVDDELAFHFEMRVRDYMARGTSERDARAAASKRLGDIQKVRSACLTIGHRRTRRMTRAQTIDALVRDIQYGIRTLTRAKLWTVITVLTLALGIGASTAVFSVVNSLVLHPIPYPDADRVVMIWRVDAKSGLMVGPSQSILEAWRRNAHSLEGVEAFESGEVTLSGQGDATLLRAAGVDDRFFGFAGMHAIAGRALAPTEIDRPGTRVAILSEALWRTRFGATKDAIGRTIELNAKPYVIVGIAPSELQLPWPNDPQTDIWIPRGADTLGFGVRNLARLRRGVSEQAAARELESIALHVDTHSTDESLVVQINRPGQMLGFGASLYLLSGAVVLLLLVACANVSHLLLARGAAREREMAIRAALGAGRLRIARQLLTESLLLAIAGCLGGIAIAVVGVRFLVTFRPASLGQLALTHLDSRAIIVAVIASGVTGIVFGFTAAMHALRRTTADSLRDTAAGGGLAAGTHRLRSLLVVSEMALSALLLLGATLLVRTVAKLDRVDPGFSTANLYSMQIALPTSRYPNDAAVFAFGQRLINQARRAPGVKAVTLASYTPPHIGFMIAPLEGEGSRSRGGPNAVAENEVGADFFQMLGIRVRGTTFTQGSSERNEVIINEGLAAKLWPHENAIGKRVRFRASWARPGDAPWMHVIGVANDVVTRGLSLDRTEPILYLPLEPKLWLRQMTLVIRALPDRDPATAVRAIMVQLDPRLPSPTVRAVASELSETIATRRFTMTLLAVFASLAVLLSGVGLYGVISYVVTQRRREIGIRIALGATPRLVARAVVARGLVLSVVGLALGLAASTWATTLIKSALYGVTGTDPLSYLATALLLLGISLLACLVPMRRAMGVDPVIAMRGD